MTTIKIPTAEELSDRLGGLDRLLTAKTWERAAIVYAFTTDGRGKNASSGVFPVDCLAFASIGYAGLQSHSTVERYRNAWQQAIDQGHVPPTVPGEPVDLPDLSWPPYFDSTSNDPRYQVPRREALERQADKDGTGKTKVIDIAKNPKAMQSAIKADPELRKAAMQAAQEAAEDESDPTVEDNIRQMRRKAQEREAADAARPFSEQELVDLLWQVRREAEHQTEIKRARPLPAFVSENTRALMRESAEKISDLVRGLIDLDTQDVGTELRQIAE